MPELHDRSARELISLIGSGTASSREVLDALIARTEAVEPTINAVTVRRYEEAREEAAAADDAVARGLDLGPMHGLPVSIKDQFHVEGLPTTWGLVSRASHRAEREGPVVTALRGAGAIPFVKTNAPVMLMETETHNPIFGRTNNPYDVDRTPGGSSGGEGALIGARGTPFGLGADIGGSLRVPAHYCGHATIKPTSHRLPWDDNPRDLPGWQEAIVPQVGPMARTVADVSLGFEVFVGAGAGMPQEPFVPPVPWADPDAVDVSGLTFAAVTDDGGVAVSPAIRRAVDEAARALEAAGARQVAFDAPSAQEVVRLYAGLLGGDGFRHLREQVGDDPMSPVISFLTTAGRAPGPVARAASRALGPLGDGVSVLASVGGPKSFYEYADLLGGRQDLLRRLAQSFHAGPDILLYPPHALPALTHGSFRDMMFASSTTFLANLTGLPAGVVPVTTVHVDEESDRKPGIDVVERFAKRNEKGSAGLPVGVQVIGPWWREDLVLAAMTAIEARVGGVPAPAL